MPRLFYMRYYVPSAQAWEEGGAFHQVYDTGMTTLASQPGRTLIGKMEMGSTPGAQGWKPTAYFFRAQFIRAR